MILLKDGMILENSGEVLSWGIKRDEAWKIGSPQHFNLPDDDTRIKWIDRILNGIDCGISAYLPDEKGLESLSIWWHPKVKTHRSDDALYHYLEFFNHLVAEIGKPEIKPSRGNFYGPILTWLHDGCTLQLFTGERHGDYTTLEINLGDNRRF